MGKSSKPGRQRLDPVAVGHPHLHVVGRWVQRQQGRVGVRNLDLGGSVLAFLCAGYPAAEIMGQ